MNEPALAPGITRGIDRLFPPLEKALGVGEGAFLLSMSGGGEEDDLGLDFLGLEFSPQNFGRVKPEGGRLDLDHVADDKPFQMREGLALEAGVRRADRRILSHQEHAFDFSIQGFVKKIEERMVARYFWNPF